MEEVFTQKINNFSPEIIYLTVNKKINSRFYMHRVRKEEEMKKLSEKNKVEKTK